jgi:predicted flavoprotein YhiN
VHVCRIVPPVPSLFTFCLAAPLLDGLAGVSVTSAQVALVTPTGLLGTSVGPVLITHAGLSGPAVLRLSAFAAVELHAAHYQGVLEVNWAGDVPVPAITTELRRMRLTHSKQLIKTSPAFNLPTRLWVRLVTACGVDTTAWAYASNTSLDGLALQIGRCHLTVTGKVAYKEEFVTAGGVDLDQVNVR